MATPHERSWLVPGAAVEVRTRFLESWAAGFEVLAVDKDRVSVRRHSDGVVLPVAIAYDDVRVSRVDSARR